MSARIGSRRGRRALWLVLLTLAAAVAGAVSGFVHRTSVDVLGLEVPVGLLAALGSLLGLVLMARMIGRSRVTVLVVAAAYAVPVLVLSQFRPEGDLVIAEDVWGLSLLGGVALIVTVGVVVPFTAYHGRDLSAEDGADHPTPLPAHELP